MIETKSLVYRVRGLTKTYGQGVNRVDALRGVDLDVMKGDLLVLLGPSGSGKSTLLNILGGLDRASAGHAWFYDRDLTASDDDALTEYRRSSVGFVFQFYNLIASLTARENVALITEIAENPMQPAEALALVGLEAGSITSQPSSPAESSSASPSPGRSPNGRRCSYATSRPARSIA